MRHSPTLKKVPGFKKTNPTGNLDIVQHNDVVYVGSVNEMNIYSLKTKERISTIKIAGFVPQVALLSNDLLLIIGNTTVYLYNNEIIENPILLDQLDIGGGVITIISYESKDSENNMVHIAYIVCDNGLKTVKISKNRKLQLLAEFLFDANLSTSIHKDIRLDKPILYVAALTHNLLYVFDISGKRAVKPKLVKKIINKFVPDCLTQTSCDPNILLCGGIFGLVFYDVTDPKEPIVISKQLNSFGNFITFIPGTFYVMNGIFQPENQLVLGEISVKKDKCEKYVSAKYKNIDSIKLQSGRLPWDVIVVQNKDDENLYEAIVTNNTEAKIEVGRVRL
ncbi:MAG: hypothetical protein Hyperionvirus3_105 [Hyperionvirus sp.]|uniref:Uncharacterized protein n=1 Tax=Hyperionvirus sp. TaxID=2487770 RepID=A0A3G5AC99_9VIRU|nr:MAG: hypothetical protein Hyperionvirus3_105 [Hyperionvirus sp.]